MGATNFIPQVWSDTLEDRWVDRAVGPNLVNRDHEGEATKGNTVKLTGVVTPEVKDYKAAGRTITPDDVSDTNIDLPIDQEKAFAFYVDDIDKAQAAGSMEEYTNAAGDALVTDSNQSLFQTMSAQGSALSGSAPTDGNSAFNLVRDAWKQLSKAKAPNDQRVLVANSEFAGYLLGADSKLTAFDTSGDGEGLRNATIGNLLNFRTVVSDDLPEVDGPAFLAFHSRAAAYVGQINEIEALRAPNKIADIVRGLNVYGSKVVKANGVWVFGITQGTLTGTPAAEKWTLAITGAPTGGTFTLTVGSTATANIAYNADNAAVAAALNALNGVSGAKVSGTTTRVITFQTAVKLAAAGSFTGGTTPAITVTATA
jgi:hypothetical protein